MCTIHNSWMIWLLQCDRRCQRWWEYWNNQGRRDKVEKEDQEKTLVLIQARRCHWGSMQRNWRWPGGAALQRSNEVRIVTCQNWNSLMLSGISRSRGANAKLYVLCQGLLHPSECNAILFRASRLLSECDIKDYKRCHEKKAVDDEEEGKEYWKKK